MKLRCWCHIVNQDFVACVFRHFLIGRCAMETDKGASISKTVKFIQRSAFSLDTSFTVMPPKVNKTSQEIYHQYVERGRLGASEPSSSDLIKYQNYASNSILQRDEWDETLRNLCWKVKLYGDTMIPDLMYNMYPTYCLIRCNFCPEKRSQKLLSVLTLYGVEAIKSAELPW